MTGVADTPTGITLHGIGKRFGAVHAVSDVDLDIAGGSIHALVGENGAGKSTLGKVIAGVHRPDTGTMRLAGSDVAFRGPRDALAAGVTIVAQELALMPTRTAAENVFLGMEPSRAGMVRRAGRLRRFRALCDGIGFSVPADVPVGRLRIADQQKVEILRAVARDCRVVVMDEPTASLTPDEATALFRTMRALRERGTTIVYVSHFLGEVLAIADDVTVLRDGHVVSTGPSRERTATDLVTAMLGRSLRVVFPAKQAPPADAPVALRVCSMFVPPLVRDVDLEVRAGEIVGLAGLVGSGRSELARGIFGAERHSGQVELFGRPVTLRSPRRAIAAGLAMVPESRKQQGLHLEHSIARNVSLPHLDALSDLGVVSRARQRRDIPPVCEGVDVRVPVTAAPVQLSGGNQQKVLFAKWLFGEPRVLLADEPTRGVDIGAKHAIYLLIHRLAAQGTAVLLISSELEEILGLAHRVLVMRSGRIVAELAGDAATEDAVMQAAFATGPRQAA